MAAVEALGDDELARYLTVDVPTAVVGEDVPGPPGPALRLLSRTHRRDHVVEDPVQVEGRIQPTAAAILSIEGARWNISSSMPRSKTSS